MNKIILSLILLCSFLSGCGSRTSSSNTANSANSKISFGVYDIASSGPSLSSEKAESTVVQTVADTRIGGGGGGGRSENRPPSTNVSLIQAAYAQNLPAATDRKIVRNAELNLEAESPEKAQREITTIAENNGGFVVESQQSSSDVKTTTRDVVVMSVRVPATKFGETLDAIRKTAGRVIEESVKGQDVTEEFIDIEARLKTQKALEQQYMEIMKRANSVEDALNVHSQLADVRGEIEKVEGRKRFLENQASLSTIKIRLQTPAALTVNSAGFGYRLSESFGSGLDFALNFILGLLTVLVAVLPLTLLIGLPGFLIGRRWWRNQSRPKSVSEIAQEEISSQ